MLLMTAAVCKLDGNALFAEPHMAVLKQWTQYLVKFGADPGEQLCTDDFAGHLSHNVNLSAKAIMGIEAYARLAAQLGRTEEAEEYHAKAAEMAKDWEKRAIADDHYVLAFGNADTWSLKYNLVWDKFFDFMVCIDGKDRRGSAGADRTGCALSGSHRNQSAFL